MGWEFSKQWKSIDDVLRYLSQSRFDSNVVVLCDPELTQEHGLRIRWQAILHRGHSYVICDLLATDQDCCWGYKDMSDVVVPGYVSCPACVLDAADQYPSQTEGALQWRAQCRTAQQLMLADES
jgi:hypothetical protein